VDEGIFQPLVAIMLDRPHDALRGIFEVHLSDTIERREHEIREDGSLVLRVDYDRAVGRGPAKVGSPLAATVITIRARIHNDRTPLYGEPEAQAICMAVSAQRLQAEASTVGDKQGILLASDRNQSGIRKTLDLGTPPDSLPLKSFPRGL